MDTQICARCGERADMVARFCERCGEAFDAMTLPSTLPRDGGASVAANAASEGVDTSRAATGSRQILERKTSEELLDYWNRRSEYPLATATAVKDILVERGVGALGDLNPPSQFKNSLKGSCPDCGYKGIMGWNKRRVTPGVAGLMVATIPLGMILSALLLGAIPIGGFLIFVPGIVLRLALQRYCAQCPQCKAWLMLKAADVSDVRKLVAA